MSKFSIKHPWIIISSIVVLFILGFSGFSKMTPELFPKMELPYVLVITAYPGANPEVVETEVTNKLENSFSSLENLEGTISDSSDNASMIFLQFAESTNIDTMTVDILEKVKQASGTFNERVVEPMILKISPDMMPTLVAAGKFKTLKRDEFSKLIDEEILDELKGISGVASVNVSGTIKDQVNVVLDETKIKALNNRARSLVGDKFEVELEKLNSKKSEIEGQLKNINSIKNKLTNGINTLLKDGAKGSDLLSEKLDEVNDTYYKLDAGILDLMNTIDLLGVLSSSINQAFGSSILDFSSVISSLNTQVNSLNNTKTVLLTAKKTLAKEFRKLENMKLSTVTNLSNNLTDIKLAILKIENGLAQIDSGVSTLRTTKESALEGIDLENILGIDTVIGLLKAQNFSMPAGSIYDNNLSYLVRVDDEIGSLGSLEEMTLMDLGIEGLSEIRLKDVATVFVSNNLASIYAKINGSDGVVFSFMKQSLSGTTEVAENIKKRFAQVEEKYPDLTFIPILDSANSIYTIVFSILQSLLFATLFTIVVLLFFLRSLKPTIITVLSIPISVAFAIILMYFSGVTINILSLSALAIATGMLVDNAIVVIENIFRLKHKGLTSLQAAVMGAKELMPALASSTLTTIAVFLPIVFVSGITRQLFQDFALTLAYALIASFIMAFTLVPIMASRLFKNLDEKKHRVWDRIAKSYKNNLSFFLRHKAVTLIVVTGLLFVSGFFCIIKGFSFMPNMTSTNMLEFSVKIEDDEEYTKLVSETDKTYDLIKDVEGIKHIGIVSGGGEGSELSFIGMGSLGASNDERSIKSTSVYLVLDNMDKGESVETEVTKLLTDAGINFEFQQLSMSNSISSDNVTVGFYGKDLGDLISDADKLIKRVEKAKNITDVESDISELKKEIAFVIDREKSAKLGLTVAEVYQQIAAKITESKASADIYLNNKNYEVVIENPFKDKIDIAYLKSLEFKNPKVAGVSGASGASGASGGASGQSSMSSPLKKMIKLSDIAEFTYSDTLPTIPHRDSRRVINVDISYNSKTTNGTKVQDYVESVIKSQGVSEGVDYEFRGSAEDTMNSIRDMMYMLLIGVVLVYLIMAAQFGSLKNPLIIMVTIPLAFTGGLIALLVTFSDISVIALIGFVMCMGIIVNNGIVLVDAINRLRISGMKKDKAIKEAGEMRLRPIIMTTATTVLGMLIMAIGIGSGTAMIRPLAIVCIGGLTYATLMTLFIVPIIYDLFNKKDIKVVKDSDLIVDKKLEKMIDEF